MIDSVTNARDQIAFFAFHSFFVKVETKAKGCTIRNVKGGGG